MAAVEIASMPKPAYLTPEVEQFRSAFRAFVESKVTPQIGEWEQKGALPRAFWRAMGERTQADLLVAGSLDFDIQDKSGYRTEEYISPYDGRSYYRQVLVENTGFEYDIVLMVFDGRTGDVLYTDNFKDFKQFEGERADPLRGMFENLVSLEDRILNVFTQKTVEATRVLLTD